MQSSLTLTYAGASAADTSDWLRIEQAPVSAAALSAADLHAMLAMVKAGISARAYKPADCEAWISGGMAYAELGLYVWPSRLDLSYIIVPDLVTLGTVSDLSMEREFDLVVDFETTVTLPCYAESISLTWQTPCYNRRGEAVAAPAMRTTGTTIRLDAEVFGVLRVRCVARGYRHTLNFAMEKTAASAITSLKPAVAVTWYDGSDGQTVSLDITLPTCLLTLLAACDDGTTIRDSEFGDSEDEEVPVIYYSPCTGQMLMMRYERP